MRDEEVVGTQRKRGAVVESIPITSMDEISEGVTRAFLRTAWGTRFPLLGSE
jgi:hypothetical protein